MMDLKKSITQEIKCEENKNMADENPPIYFNFPALKNRGYFLNIVIGDRGCGKTYGLQMEHIKGNLGKLLYIRRYDKTIKKCKKGKGNPYKDINEDFKRNIGFYGSDDFLTIDEIQETGETINLGYALALNNADERGISFRDVGTVLFDEFIKKPNERRIKEEADVFFNILETVNRNRELKGGKPVQTFMFSNAVSIDSPILAELDLIGVLEEMIKNDSEEWTDDDRGIIIIMPKLTVYRQHKQLTSLGKLTAGTTYYNHAYENKFAYDSFYNVKREPLREYIPLCGVDDFYIYKHKSKPRYYMCRTRADCPNFTEKDSLLLFRKNYGIYLKNALISGKIMFSDFHSKTKLTEWLE